MSTNLEIARYELKFPVHPDQFGSLVRALGTYCVPDAPNPARDGWSTVTSLYFDSADYRSYRDTQLGLPHRYKVRVRSYDSPSSPVKLEVKRRRHKLVLKSSALLDRPRWHACAPHGLAPLTSADPRYREFENHLQLLGTAAPRMLVAYDRLAFASTLDDYVRVTFDSKMRCQRIDRLDLEGSPRRWHYVDDSFFLMEVKFADTAPRWLADLISRYHLRARGFSKYGTAVSRLVYGREPAWDLRSAPHLFREQFA